MSDTVWNWGTTPPERACSYPCDAALPDHNEAYFRGLTVRAQPAVLFRWLCQLRAAPYSYDWIDNHGLESPQELVPGLEELELGQTFMRIFELIDFQRDRHLTLWYRDPGSLPPLAVSYCVARVDDVYSRLVVKLVLRYGNGLRHGLMRALAPWLDWLMMRRQLLNLKALSEGPGGREPGAHAPFASA